MKQLFFLLISVVTFALWWHAAQNDAPLTVEVVSEPIFFLSKANSNRSITSEFKSNSDLARNGRAYVPDKPLPIPAASLLQTLYLMDQGDVLTEEQLHRVESILRNLTNQGTRAVADIREILLSEYDILFESEDGSRASYSSLRMALIDLLKQIGGFVAEQVLLEQLNTDPRVIELAAIADALEWLQPGLYTEFIMEAVDLQLAVLSAPFAPEKRTESGPLFQILQKYGSAEVAELLYQAPYWLQEYALLALANLSDQQGVALLAQKVRRDLRGSRDTLGLHLLAQIAVNELQAEMILLDLVRADAVPEAFWPTIGDILMGDRQLQIENPLLRPDTIGSLLGNSNYSTHTTVDRQVQTVYSVSYSAQLSAQEVRVRLNLINKMMRETLNANAISVLWDARSTLENFYWQSR